MFDKRVISLSGIITEKKKLSGVKAKWSPPEGFFSQSSTEIVKGLLAAPGGHAKAMSRLNFYINRAGKNLEGKDAGRLEKAKEQLSKKLAAIKEEAEMYAHRAGLVFEKKQDDEEADMDLGADEAPAKDKKKDDDEEETLPKIVLKIAKKAVGKSEEDLADLLMKVYETGFKDGVKSTEEKDDKKSGKDDDKSADDSDSE